MKILFTPHWNRYFSYFSNEQYDVYFKEEYVYLYETPTEKPYCAVIYENDSYMLFPFLKREFTYNEKTFFDFETAYGYGGPICNVNNESFWVAALRSLSQEFSNHGCVAGFVRFHPLLDNYRKFDSIGKVIFDRKTIAMDLSLDENDIWMNEIHTKNRNVIKKGDRNGLKFVVDDAFAYLPQFARLYNSTMDKLSADGFYYFNDAYYRSLKERIDNRFLGVVKLEEEVLSAAIFFCHPPYGHYHLSGSDKAYLGLSPNNYMLYNAALELKRRGVRRFHLGGGTTSGEDDSLFCFKSRFSRNTCQFAIGKLLFNETVYQALCADWEVRNPDKKEHYKYFLLKYKY